MPTRTVSNSCVETVGLQETSSRETRAEASGLRLRVESSLGAVEKASRNVKAN